MRIPVLILGTLFATLLGTEVLLRLVGPSVEGTFAIVAAIDRVGSRESQIESRFEESTGYELPFEELSTLEPRLFEAVYHPSNRDLLAELHAEYERQFVRLADAVEELGSLLVVMYLPSNWNDPNRAKLIGGSAHALFRRLAADRAAPFLDLTDDITTGAWNDMTLHPRDSHLSELANLVVAAGLAAELRRHPHVRSPSRFAEKPTLLGDNEPSQDAEVEWEPGMPFQLVTNAQGLRMDEDVDLPKTKQRLLVLGDSFTFGPHIPNSATYPAILAKLMPELEVLNAGHVGYTITDEADLFIERARFAEPDIVVLQVLDNDVYGLLAVMQNVFGRRKHIHGRSASPSLLEIRFLDSLLGASP